jgi:hypothetical protein
MKLRIDKVSLDSEGQIVVHITRVQDWESFPVPASGQCYVFKNKAEVVAALSQVREASSFDALRLAVAEWRKSDTNLNDFNLAMGKIGDAATTTEKF